MTISKSSFLGYVYTILDGSYKCWQKKPICSRIRTMASAQYYFCNRAKLCHADLKSKVSHTG